MSLLDQLQILKDGLAGADHRLQELFSSSEVGACLIGQDGRFERLNPAWESCLGHPTGSMLGNALLDFVHPDDRGPTQSATAKLKREATVRFRNRFRQSDGNYRTLQWVAARVNGTGAICAVVQATASGIEDRGADQEPTPFARLLRSVARAGDEPANVTGALQFALDRVCAQTGWPVGHAMIPDERSAGGLVSAKIWHLADEERFAALPSSHRGNDVRGGARAAGPGAGEPATDVHPRPGQYARLSAGAGGARGWAQIGFCVPG